ncbi:hypothetical protein ACFTY8_26340 [Streptomyces mirabilis]|uniref:hypothetical protein n=1 Tax=Streptomyces mirabilis TaxID=68239 RepID=UPI0036347B28
MVATRGGPDVLVVGARDLTRAGLGVRVLEASDGVGVDRGFQATCSLPPVR